MFVIMPRWTEQQLTDAVASADSYSDVLRHFGLRTAGGNHAMVKRWIERWGIRTDHFTHGGDRLARHRRAATPIDEARVAGSSYHRGHLKRRLYAAGVKSRQCELCGQGELWRGARMSLILDHINGISNDNRLENLRIVCPNCNATLATHCGRNKPRVLEPRPCGVCGTDFEPNFGAQLYCSRDCGSRHPRSSGPRPSTRKVERPPYEQLLEEVATSSWAAVGRRYGVSCNAVRKWVRAEQRLRTAEADVPPGARE